MNKHIMKLNPAPFEMIKRGQKTIEMRLYDEKRQKISVNDLITFINTKNDDEINVIVKELHLFKNFDMLYSKFDKELIGYTLNEVANPKDMEQYYSKDMIIKYGVVGIEIELI